MDDLNKNILVTWLQGEFKNSRDNCMRLSLIVSDVQDDLTVSESLEAVFDVSFFNDLSYTFNYLQQKEPPKSLKDMALYDMHYFQVFLTGCKKAGAGVNAAADSDELFPKKSGVEFINSAYLVRCEDPTRCSKIIDFVVQNCPESDIIGMLVFLATHLEFQL